MTSTSMMVNMPGTAEALRKRSLGAHALLGKLSLSQLEPEVTAQLAMLRDAGVRVSHLDGHKHLHQLPVVCAAVANVLPRFGIERVRITRLASIGEARSASMLAREIYCHPGTAAADQGKPGSHRRGQELEFLLSPQFRAVLAASGALLVSYWRV
ncbi:MAG: ChbG/HpnK family deacetylase [Steroidobacteraceae bacterium]